MNAALRRALYACMAALAATGVLYAIPRYGDLYLERDWPTVVSPALLMKVHGALAIWALLLLGGIWRTHVRARVRRPDNRVAGLVLVAAMAFLTASGWLLYYAGSRGLREFSSLAHTACGVAVLAVMLWHVRRGRAAVRRRSETRARRYVRATAARDSPPEALAGRTPLPAALRGSGRERPPR